MATGPERPGFQGRDIMLPERDSQAFASLLHQEVEKRRTFAIISHPDAGKTTLT